jgi:hypothetical protein
VAGSKRVETDDMPMRKCFLCGRQFQFGPNAYLGSAVKAWDIMVCNDCHASQRGGIVPAIYPHLIEHLKARGIKPEYDDHGWIRWPLPD